MSKLTLSNLGVLFLFSASLFFVSCKKDISNVTEVPVSENIPAKDGIPAYYFDWETADYMPTPPTHTIYVPWANGAVKGFPSDIWYDYKVSDGWRLVYNQFDPNATLPSNPFFVLYNQFRGLLRIYIYVTTPGFTNSDYLTDGLSLSPNSINSSMLNFIGRDIVDVSINQAIATKIEATQIASGTWYASQYEIAYDPNIATSTYQQVGLNWTLKWTNITSVNMEGSVVGTLKGTITTPSSGFNLGSLATGALQAAGLSVFSNNAGPDPNHPGIGNTLGLPAYVFESAKSGISDGFSGTVRNLFSAVFGGNSNNSQQVSLTLNANITLTGSLTGSGALIPSPGLGIGVPGTTNSQSAPGLIPYYNEPMGVFNLSAKPTVYVSMVEFSDGTIEGTSYQYNPVLDQSTVQPIFNPVVTANAAIQNYRVESFTYNIGGMEYYVQPVETIGGVDIFWGSLNVPFGFGGPFVGRALVRISFDVVPNNGAPRSKIIKTFEANVVNI